MKRRKMIRDSLLTVSGICTCPLSFASDEHKSNQCVTPQLEEESITFLKDTIHIDRDKAVTIAEQGFAGYIIDNKRNINLIIVHDEFGEFHALERLCTHGGRSLSYIKGRNLLQCNNFNHSTFSLSGEVYNGPAPKAIRSFQVDQRENSITIKFD